MAKTKKRYSAAEKRAYLIYWIGVGIAAEQRGEADVALGYSRWPTIAKKQASARAGFQADRSKFVEILAKL